MDTKIKIFDELSLSSVIDKDAELIPLMTEEDEERLNAEEMPNTLAILPLRNTVLFPGVVIPITVGRDKSIKLIKEANNGDKVIGVVAQKDAHVEDPHVDDLNVTGTVAKIYSTKSPNFSLFSRSFPHDVISTPVKTISLTPCDTKLVIWSVIWIFSSDLELPLAKGIMQKVQR